MDLPFLRVVLYKYALKKIEFTGEIVQMQIAHRGAFAAVILPSMERIRVSPGLFSAEGETAAFSCGPLGEVEKRNVSNDRSVGGYLAASLSVKCHQSV